MKHYVDKLRSEREFEVGDLIYLRLQPYRQSSLALQRNMKLALRFYGVWTFSSTFMSGQSGLQAVTTRFSSNTPYGPFQVFHVSLLKKKLGENVVATPTLPPVSDDGTLQIEPVVVLERRMVKRNNRAVIQWLVQWFRSFPKDAT